MLASDETTAVWEKRFNLQVAATEEALLAKRNAEIALREAERLLQEIRFEAARAGENFRISSDSPADLSSTIDQLGEWRSAGGGGDMIKLRL